jgi:hypothetical protein
MQEIEQIPSNNENGSPSISEAPMAVKAGPKKKTTICGGTFFS